MKRKHYIVTIKSLPALGLLFLLTLFPGDSFSQSNPIGEIQFQSLCISLRTKIEQSLLGTGIPGVSAAVLLPDGRSCTAVAGVSDLATRRKLEIHDPILAGSIGKTFVSALALKLVEEGKVELDQKIEFWLGQKPWFARLSNARDITVRMLMNHSSGIPNHVDEKSFEPASIKGANRDIAFDDLLTFILNKKAPFPAGKGYLYADTNYILLAMIVEKVTGRTMYDQVAERFLKPLKLDHTSPSDKNLDPAVHGYYQNTPMVKNGRLMINPQWEWAGGGFYSTPDDLTRWAQELYSKIVLKPESFDSMINSTSPGEGKNYGLGVEILNTKWGVSYGHDGEWPGYLSTMRFYPTYGIAIAGQINASGTPTSEKFLTELPDDLAGVFIDAMMNDRLSAAESETIRATVETWLKLIDAGKFAESWDEIAGALKAKYTRAAWPSALKPLVEKTGRFKSRSLKSAVMTNSNTIVVEFSSAFSKVPMATETIFLTLEGNHWMISSYSIR